MLTNNIQKEYGFSTLFAVVLLGSIALSIAIYFSTISFYSVRSGIDSKDSVRALYLTDSCMENVLELIRNNHSLTATNSNLTIDGIDCVYSVVNVGTDIRRINVSVNFKNFSKKIEVMTKTLDPISLEYWVEK